MLFKGSLPEVRCFVWLALDEEEISAENLLKFRQKAGSSVSVVGIF